MELFRINGKPDDKHWYLFNGDFVDRGSWSTEIALLLYANKWLRPNGFFLNRGNHETDDMNRIYGFEGECKAKYNERLVHGVAGTPLLRLVRWLLTALQDIQTVLGELLGTAVSISHWIQVSCPPWWLVLGRQRHPGRYQEAG